MLKGVKQSKGIYSIYSMLQLLVIAYILYNKSRIVDRINSLVVDKVQNDLYVIDDASQYMMQNTSKISLPNISYIMHYEW